MKIKPNIIIPEIGDTVIWGDKIYIISFEIKVFDADEEIWMLKSDFSKSKPYLAHLTKSELIQRIKDKTIKLIKLGIPNKG